MLHDVAHAPACKRHDQTSHPFVRPKRCCHIFRARTPSEHAFHSGSGAELDLGIRSDELRWIVKLLQDSVFHPNRLVAPTTSAQHGGPKQGNAHSTVGWRLQRLARAQTRGLLAQKRREPQRKMVTCKHDLWLESSGTSSWHRDVRYRTASSTANHHLHFRRTTS